MPRRLSDYAGVLLDLDGTLLRHNDPLPHAPELVAHLSRCGVPMLVVSNTTNGPESVASRLAAAGMAVGVDRILTAAVAAVDLIATRVRARHGRPPAVFNLGQPDVDGLLLAVGALVNDAMQPCDAVLVGAPSNPLATPARARTALHLLRRGASLVGICADRVYPSTHGLEFGCGAFCQMLAYAGGTRPTFCGKPERVFFQDALARLGSPAAADVLMVGDNLEADVVGARSAGLRACLVLGGVSTLEEAHALPDVIRPNLVAASLKDLLDELG